MCGWINSSVPHMPSHGGKMSYLTEIVYQLVLESQIPHQIVNLVFTITN